MTSDSLDSFAFTLASLQSAVPAAPIDQMGATRHLLGRPLLTAGISASGQIGLPQRRGAHQSAHPHGFDGTARNQHEGRPSP